MTCFINTTHENNATKENMSQLTFLLFYLRRLSKTRQALCFILIYLLDIRKLKAALATPLDFGDGDNDMDVDTGSEVSAAQAPKKVNATSVKNGLSRKWFRNGKFNLGNKIRKMYNGYYLVSMGQEIWYHRMLRDLNQGTIFFKF